MVNDISRVPPLPEDISNGHTVGSRDLLKGNRYRLNTYHDIAPRARVDEGEFIGRSSHHRPVLLVIFS